MDKSLKEKAIDIKGKLYVPVAERIVYFNDTYPDGQIRTELVSTPESKTVVVKATVEPIVGRQFTGYSQAIVGNGYINQTSALENAETSAVGRALAMMGIGVVDSVASADEVAKASPARKDYMFLISLAKTTEELTEVGNDIKSDTGISPAKKAALRAAYESKMETLK